MRKQRNPLQNKMYKWAKEHRENPTPAEDAFWQAVRCSKLGFMVERQVVINKFIIDFYVKGIRLAIEIDGGYHTKQGQIEKDKDRTAKLIAWGSTVLRFTNEQVLESLPLVLDEVKRHHHRLIAQKALYERLGMKWPTTVEQDGERLELPGPEDVLRFGDDSPLWDMKLSDILKRPEQGTSISISWKYK